MDRAHSGVLAIFMGPSPLDCVHDQLHRDCGDVDHVWRKHREQPAEAHPQAAGGECRKWPAERRQRRAQPNRKARGDRDRTRARGPRRISSTRRLPYQFGRNRRREKRPHIQRALRAALFGVGN